MKYITLFSLLFIISCSSINKGSSYNLTQLNKTLSQRTQTVEKHEGFQNLFNISATLLDKDAYKVIIEKQAHDESLSPKDLRELKEKTSQILSNETHFFVSYYSPIKSLKKLNKSKAWKVFLERDGRRYPAVINNYPGNKYKNMSTFKSLTRWSKGYLLKVRVPTSAVENTPVKLIFSSSSGKAIFTFPKKD